MHKRTAHGEDTTAELEAQVYNEQIFGKFSTQVYNEQIFSKFNTQVYNVQIFGKFNTQEYNEQIFSKFIKHVKCKYLVSSVYRYNVILWYKFIFYTGII